MKTIEIIIDAKGQARLETKGYSGDSCRDASRFIENALGQSLRDQPTTESHQLSTERARNTEGV